MRLNYSVMKIRFWISVPMMALLIAGCAKEVPPGQVGPDGKVTVSAADMQNKAKQQGVDTSRSEEGKLTVSSAGPSEAQLGVPYYPGSTPVEKQGFITGTPGARMFHSKRAAIDSPEKVLQWYAKQLKDMMTVPPNVDSQMIVFEDGKARSGSIKVEKKDGKTLITIVVQEMGTEPAPKKEK